MDIKEARKVFSEEFAKDVGLTEVYIANIAMMIYDDQMAGIEERSNEAPTNLSTVEGCNSMAEQLLWLIFSS